MNDHYLPDATTLANDDELLDALGRGEYPAGDDALTAALAMWREEIAAPTAVTAAQPVRRKRHSVRFIRNRIRRWTIISAAVAAIIGGGVTVATASTAQPGSPLWPVTERVWVDRASSASAEAARGRIQDARVAVEQERPKEAQGLIEEAEGLIPKVKSTLEQNELTAELATVVELLERLLDLEDTGSGTDGTEPAPKPSSSHSTGPSPSPSPSGRKNLIPCLIILC